MRNKKDRFFSTTRVSKYLLSSALLVLFVVASIKSHDELYFDGLRNPEPSQSVFISNSSSSQTFLSLRLLSTGVHGLRLKVASYISRRGGRIPGWQRLSQRVNPELAAQQQQVLEGYLKLSFERRRD